MTSQKELSPELENAVQALLKPPHIHFLKELHTETRLDPQYLFNNESSVGASIQDILLNAGVQLKPDLIKQQWARVLGIALHRVAESR